MVKKAASKKVEVESEPLEGDIAVPSSSSDDSEFDSDVEGLSSAEEDADVEVVTEHRIKKLDKKSQSKNITGDKAKESRSGIIYVSRLPHGFHEKELSKYFSQFGDLKEVRLARNKKTGNSRHYGFVEFINKDDAKVAEESMNNYLVMGHLLQVRVMPKGAKIDKLYRYKKRVFVETPIKKDIKQLKKQSEEKHAERIQKLQAAGINFKW